MKTINWVTALGMIALIAGITYSVFTSKQNRPQAEYSALAEAPDWASLEIFQYTISRDDFETLLTEIFTTDSTWREYIDIQENQALIRKSQNSKERPFALQFSTLENQKNPPRNWQSSQTLPPASSEKPLAQLHIAIDAGHMGGEWAKIEERWFQIGEDQPVLEGEMTLFVAKLLKPLLEAKGAKVSLVREDAQPLTSSRPNDFLKLARENSPEADEATLKKRSERYFYRTAEIRARAERVNVTIKPDLVLCLHFNAEAWGDPTKPTLVDRTHFHILVNGGYTSEEIRLADQRFSMLKKLLQRTHEEEILVGKTMAEVFAEVSGLPAYTYSPLAKNFRSVASSPFLYARNLLANRLYDCPVLFLEPYVMNSTHDYARIQAGDYSGLREIKGKLVPSIFQEYAEALAQGLTKHYGEFRQKE